MSLSLQSRCVGDVTVVTCAGRIVAGEESASLRTQLDRLLPMSPYVLLHLGGVDFIDSGGLGLLARYLTRAENIRGTLKVCAVSPKIDEVLRVTRLKAVFQPFESETDSIVEMHRGSRADRAFENPEVLCVESSPDVLAYLRELLKNAGYRALTAANLPDALILLKATRPKVVVIGADLRAARDTRAAQEFNRAADAIQVVELPTGFSGHDAADAAKHVLEALG